MWLESEAGSGSTFHFTVSLAVPFAPGVSTRLPAPEMLHGLAVLVVDDNATNRRILYETLAAWKMRPVLADSGASALLTLRQHAGAGERFALLLLDAQMPGMDGFTLARQIQEDPEIAGPRIMMLSSLDLGAIQPELRQSGHYLVKPVTRPNLLNAILRVLGGGSRQHVLPRGAVPSAAGRSLRVLLADDNAVNRKVASRLLEKQGHTVELACDGAEALAAFAHDSFDLILMDVQMPVMNGYDATRAIRAQERGTPQHISIVALTAHAIKGDREICLAAGMDDYLGKPIRPAELAAVLERWRPTPKQTPVAPDEPTPAHR
jgi:CheY-like chemotaxis protein